MAKRKARGAAKSQGNMTLTEVSKRTKISMPTLQKYKKRYSDRIPSVGKGRRQRYPEESLKVFLQLRDENMARRGRPRKYPVGSTRKERAAAARKRAGRRGGEGLLTLTQVAQRTKISYPTLLRYVKTSLDKIPHVGTGRRRRFREEAVPVFQSLRASTRLGRPPGSKTGAKRRGRPPGRAGADGSLVSRLKALVRSLEKRVARLESEVKKPLRVVRR